MREVGVGSASMLGLILEGCLRGEFGKNGRERMTSLSGLGEVVLIPGMADAKAGI